MTTDALIERWVRPEIRALAAYHVPDPGAMIKLDAMENPYPLPEPLRSEWAARLRDVDLNRYPDPAARDLAERLRAVMRIPADAGLLLGNGSDEIIQMLALTLAGAGHSILSVEPGFVMYRMIATFARLDYAGVALNADFSLDLDALLDAIARTEPAIVFLACPNNPTGNLFPRGAVERVIDAAPGIVVVDEAYAPFTDASMLGDCTRYPNLLVMRTLSKMGLAGLRLGYLAGPRAWIDQVDKTRLPYNINVLTQASAAFALDHSSLFDEQARTIRTERGRLVAALEAVPGITPFPSEANFVLLRTPSGRARALFEALKRHGVLIKCLDGAHPLLADCLRVTVGTPDENVALLDALAGALDA